jgi:hypothetical protein
VILTVHDFLEATTFERGTISLVYPLVDEQSPRARFDLRKNTAYIQVASIVSGSGEAARNSLINQFRPLLFGAAWKTIDLLVELGLNQQTLRQRWQIKDKQAHAASAPTIPFTQEPQLWSRVAAVYSGTVEVRHCLTHRQFRLSGGSMTNMWTEAGVAIADFSVSDQNAFCRVAQRCSIATQAKHLSLRDKRDLIASLDLLTAKSGHAPIGGGATEVASPLIQINAKRQGLGWTVDTLSALSTGKKTWSNVPYFDIEISFPDTGLAPLVGRLDEAPQALDVPIDPANPPAWIET